MGTEQELAGDSSTCSPAVTSAALAHPFFPFFFFFLILFTILAACAGSPLLCRLFSSYSKQGSLSSCGVRASHCSDFSYGAQAPRPRGFPVVAGSRAQAPQLWHTGLAAPQAARDPPRPGTQARGSCIEVDSPPLGHQGS